MPRLLPLLPATLFLAGIAAGHFGRGDRSPVSGNAPEKSAAAPAKEEADISPPAGPGEEHDYAVRAAGATLAEIRALWDALEPGDPGQAFGAYLSIRSGPWKRMLLLERWAELDGPGALAAAREIGGDYTMLFQVVFRTWAARDPDAAMAAVRAETRPERRIWCALGWLSAWEDEPASFSRRFAELKWMDASNLSEFDFHQAVSEDVMRRIYAADREGMLTLRDWLPPWYGELLQKLDWRAAWTKGGEEARAAVDSMARQPGDIRRMARDLTPLFRSRPEEAMDLLERLTAKDSRSNAAELRSSLWTDTSLVQEMVRAMGTTDPERVIRMLRLKDPESTAENALHGALMMDLARRDPVAALRLSGELTELYHLGVHTGAPPPRLEPSAALAAVRDAPPSWLRDTWLDRALLEMAPAEAAAWVETLPKGELRSSAHETLNSRDLSEAERALCRVVSQFPGRTIDESARERVWNAALRSATGSELPELARRITHLPDGAARDEALMMVTQQWATFDLQQAISRNFTEVDPELRAAHTRGIVRTWAESDPVEASAWVDSLHPGRAREAAVEELIPRLAEKDPEAAAHWAASLTDPAARQERLSAVVIGWASRDAAAAAAGVRTLPGLSDSERVSLLNSLPSRP